MMRDGTKLIVNEAKRFPIIKEMLDDIINVTDEQIEAARFPLSWYGKALRQLRNKAIAESNLPEVINFKTSNDSIGDVIIYNGEKFYAKSPCSRLEIEIEYGDMIFLDHDLNVAWIGDLSFVLHHNLMSNTVTTRQINREGYATMYNEFKSSRMGDYTPARDYSNPMASVRISRL